MNVPRFDPLAPVITEDTIEKLPLEVAKKVTAIGLHVPNGVLTVAMAAPPTPTSSVASARSP